MSTPLLHPEATVTVAGVTVPVERGELTLDEGWAPYCQTSIVAPFDDPAAVTAIDPRRGDRAVITASVGGFWEQNVQTGYLEDPAVPGAIVPVSEGGA